MLQFIQILLVIVLVGMIGSLCVIAYRGKLPVFKRFGTGALIGFVTDFGDTLGIGSFATTTAAFRMTRFMRDERQLPGTLNTVHAIPVMIQALFFITAVKVDMMTLIPMTLAAVIGAMTGTRLTKNWHTPTVQKVLGVALLIAVIVMVVRMLTNPGETLSEDVHGLEGWLLVIGIIFNFIIGNLMTVGLGNYTPELIFFSLVGVNPAIAFPIMMLDAALITATSAVTFIKTGRVEWRGFGSVLVGGIFGVIIAATLFTALNVTLLQYLVVIVATWTALSLLRDGFSKRGMTKVVGHGG
jgi:uncharacterized membrane protein YfcA